MPSNPSRRSVLGVLLSGAAVLALPVRALALSVDQASRLVQSLVNEVNTVIASGKSEAGMFADFERIFIRYADVPTIAQRVLGPAARSASSAQMSAYVKAFTGYISRRYGRRFREFIGGKIEVVDARAIKSFYEVITVARLRGQEPFDLRFHVSDKSGKLLFFNMIIEGVNMMAAESTEIRAMLDKRRGNMDQMIEDLKRAG
ncbi:MAG: ABC transporter substrate-binding protein [Paracoccaceae bacterium]